MSGFNDGREILGIASGKYQARREIEPREPRWKRRILNHKESKRDELYDIKEGHVENEREEVYKRKFRRLPAMKTV